MSKLLKNEKLLIFTLVIVGFLSVLINLSINYDLSFSAENKRAYELIEKISKYPKPLVIFSKKSFEKLNDNDLMETQTWLDKSNFSKSKVKVVEGNIHIAVYYSSNFKLSKYLYKVLSLTNIAIENLEFNFEKSEIKIILGKL